MYCFSKVCYVCLKQENTLLNIKNTSEAYAKLLRKLNSCMLNVKWSKVSYNGILICATCNNTLTIAYDFLSVCRKTTARWESYIDIFENSSMSSKKNRPHRAVIKLVDVMKIKTCEKTTASSVAKAYSRMGKHNVSKGHKNTEKIKQSEHGISLRRGDTGFCGFSNKEIRSSYLYSTALNRKIIRDNENFQRMMVTSRLFKQNNPASKSSKCLVCNKTFAYRSSLYNHYKIHSGDKQYQCEYCLKEFVQKSQLNDHMHSHSEEKPFQCTVCKRNYSRLSTLQRHKTVHSNETFVCCVCTREFSCKLYLDRHYCTMHSDPAKRKYYTCTTCQKKFTTSSSLHVHYLVHTGVKAHVCSVCDRKFTNKSTLTRHMLVHTGQKRYACTHCEKYFSLKTNLKVHIMIHKGIKPFKCSVCDRTFVQKNSLDQHELIHKDMKPHKCHICKKLFRSVSAMHQHQLIHTNRKRYACSLCDLKFKVKTYLKRHVDKHHADD